MILSKGINLNAEIRELNQSAFGLLHLSQTVLVPLASLCGGSGLNFDCLLFLQSNSLMLQGFSSNLEFQILTLK